MPDPIRTEITLDTAQFKDGSEQVKAVTKQTTDELKVAWIKAGEAVKVAVAEMKAAQASLGPYTGAGGPFGDKVRADLEEYKSKLTAAVSVQREAKGAIDAQAAAIREAALGEEEYSRWQSDIMQHKFENVTADTTEAILSQTRAIQETNGALSNTGNRFIAARYAGILMARDIGVQMPWAMSRVMGSMAGIGPILQAAFPVILAVSFLEILGKIPGVIQNGISALRGWSEEAKKTYGEQSAIVASFPIQRVTRKDVLAKADEAGLTGVAKLKKEYQNLQDAMHLAGGEADDAASKVDRSAGELKKIGSGLEEVKSKYGEVTGGLAAAQKWVTDQIIGGVRVLASGREIETNKDAIKDYDKTEDELRKKRNAASNQLTAKRKELDFQIKQDAIDLSESQIRADEKTAAKRISIEEDRIKRQHEIGIISAEQERDNLLDQIDAERIAREKSIDQQISAAKAQEALTGRPSGPKVTELMAEREEAELAYTQRSRDIATNYQKWKEDKDLAISLSAIEGAKNTSVAEANLAEQTAREMYDAKKIEAGQETNLVLAARNDRYIAEVKAVNDEIILRQQFGDRFVVEVDKLQRRLVEMKVAFQAEVEHVEGEGERKEIEKEVREFDRKVAHIQKMANLELQGTMKSTSRADITPEIADKQRTATADWFNHQKDQFGELLKDFRGSEQEKAELEQRLSEILEGLAEEVANKNEEIGRREEESFKRRIEQQISKTRELANLKLEESMKDIKGEQNKGPIAAPMVAKQETTATNQWYNDQRKQLDQYIADVKAKGQEDSDLYRRLKDDKEKLDVEYHNKLKDIQRQEIQEFTAAYRQMSDVFFNNFNRFLQGQISFGKAMTDAWRGMIMSMIKDVEKWANEMIIKYVIIAGLKKLLHVAPDDDSDSKKEIETSKELFNAKISQAAATVFADAMMAIPFPANTVAAPAIASAMEMFGQSLQLMKLETGGLVPNTGIALLHKGEEVVSSPVVNMVRQMNQSSSSSSSSEFHYHAAPGESPSSINSNLAALSRAMRDGRIPRFA